MLKVIATQLNTLGVPYEYMRWSGTVSDPYFVGEYSQVTTLSEDGLSEYTFMLNGFSRGSWADLEEIKQKIEQHFPVAGGLRIATDDGSAVVITFESAYPVDTGEADLKRIQINLNVKKWESR